MELNLNLIAQLVRLDWVKYKKKYFGLIGIFFTVMFGVLSLRVYNHDLHDFNDFHHDVFPFFFLIGGAVMCLSSFQEFRTDETRSQYLGIPASTLDKLISKMIWVLPIFFLISFGGYFLFSSISNGILSAFSSRYEFQYFNPFDYEDNVLFKIYWIAHSSIVMASIWFNKFAIPKSFGLTLATTLAFALIMGLIFRILFPELFDGLFSVTRRPNIRPSVAFEDFMKGPFVTMVKVIGFGVVPVYYWIVNYFKLKEKEA